MIMIPREHFSVSISASTGQCSEFLLSKIRQKKIYFSHLQYTCQFIQKLILLLGMWLNFNRKHNGCEFNSSVSSHIVLCSLAI